MPAEAETNHTILDPETQREALQQYVAQVTQGMVDEIKLNNGKTGHIHHRLWDIVQKSMIQTVLDNTSTTKNLSGNQTQVAKLLGINRATLRRRIERYGIEARLMLTDEEVK